MARQKSEFLSALGILFEIFRLLVNDILAAGGSDEDIRRIGTDSNLREKLVEVVLAAKGVVFPPWRTIVLGVHKSADEYRTALKAKGFQLSDWASDILGKITFSEKEISVELVKVSVAELGFNRNTSLRDILAKAQELGLGLCEPEIGPALREQYSDQPHGEYLWIGMEPVRDSDDYPLVFDVRHDDDARWLYASWDGLDFVWDPDGHFVFVRK